MNRNSQGNNNKNSQQKNFNNHNNKRTNFNNNNFNNNNNNNRNGQFTNLEHTNSSGNLFKDPNDRPNFQKPNTTPFLEITDIKDFPTPPTYSSLSLSPPTLLHKITPLDLNKTPHIKQERRRPCAKLKQNPLDFLSNVLTPSFSISKKTNDLRCKNDNENDPIMKMIKTQRETPTQFKFGDISFDIVSCVSNFIGPRKTSIITTSNSNSTTQMTGNRNSNSSSIKAKHSNIKSSIDTDQFTTPILKRHRDELLVPNSLGNSSIKKNKRPLIFESTPQGSNDTMDLSFEGKAMDKSELIRLVNGDLSLDDSSVMISSSVGGLETPVGFKTQKRFVDTRELLGGLQQHTDQFQQYGEKK